MWEKYTFNYGKRDGPYEYYYEENGQLHEKGTYKDDEKAGPWESYYDNGQLSDKGTYKNGMRDGYWEYYNKDGTVNEKYTGTYKNDEKISD